MSEPETLPPKRPPLLLVALIGAIFIGALVYVDTHYTWLQYRSGEKTVSGSVVLSYRYSAFSKAVVRLPLPEGWTFTYNKGKPTNQGTMVNAAGKSMCYLSFYHPNGAARCEAETPAQAYQSWISANYPETLCDTVEAPAGSVVLAFPGPVAPMQVFPEQEPRQGEEEATIAELVLCQRGKLACVRFIMPTTEEETLAPIIRELATEVQWVE